MQVNEGFWGRFGGNQGPWSEGAPGASEARINALRPTVGHAGNQYDLLYPLLAYLYPGRYVRSLSGARKGCPHQRAPHKDLVWPSQGARPTREGTLWLAQENRYVNDVRIGCPPAPHPRSSA